MVGSSQLTTRQMCPFPEAEIFLNPFSDKSNPQNMGECSAGKSGKGFIPGLADTGGC